MHIKLRAAIAYNNPDEKSRENSEKLHSHMVTSGLSQSNLQIQYRNVATLENMDDMQTDRVRMVSAVSQSES